MSSSGANQRSSFDFVFYYPYTTLKSVIPLLVLVISGLTDQKLNETNSHITVYFKVFPITARRIRLGREMMWRLYVQGVATAEMTLA